MKTTSKCLALMKGCSDPEFEPRVEEIVDYRQDMAILISQFTFFGELVFPILNQSSTWQVEVKSGSTGSLCMPQYYAIRSMRSWSMCPRLMCPRLIMGASGFMRDIRDVVSFSLHPESLSTKKNSANQ